MDSVSLFKENHALNVTSMRLISLPDRSPIYKYREKNKTPDIGHKFGKRQLHIRPLSLEVPWRLPNDLAELHNQLPGTNLNWPSWRSQ